MTNSIKLQNNSEEDIEREIEGGEEDLNEERLIGPQDEGDNDPYDTTPDEASKLADEGEEILKEERRRRQNPDDF